MKKCRRCTKPATLHITEIQDGVVQELHLCEVCAQQYLTAAPNVLEKEVDELSVKISQVTDEAELEELDELVCPSCGITFKEFRQQGRLGCPHDYVAFERELLPLLDNIHGETEHQGKFPRRAPNSGQRQYQLIKLRNQLRTSVDQENYEEAAKLRDQIQTLEEELANEAPQNQ